MNKKLILLFFLFALPFLLQVLNSCSPYKCNNQCHIVTDVLLRLADNGDSMAHEIVNSQVKAKALILAVDFKDSIQRGFCGSRNDFIPSAYAVLKKACLGSEFLFIDSLAITSDKKFDAVHPANSNLLDLFYSDFSSGNPASGSQHFYLTHAPDDTGTYTFSIYLILQGDQKYYRDTFIAQSEPVKLLK